MPPPLVYLARHGQSLWNGTKRVSGQMNPPLSALGQIQAQALRRMLHDAPLTKVYCSTLDRAVATAAPVARDHAIPLIACAELMEQNLGILEGRYRDERDPSAQALWQQRSTARATFRIPGGETQAELKARVLGWLKVMLAGEGGGRVLVVGHRNTNRVIMGSLLNLDEAQWGTLRPLSRIVHQFDLVGGHHSKVSLAPYMGVADCQVLEDETR